MTRASGKKKTVLKRDLEKLEAAIGVVERRAESWTAKGDAGMAAQYRRDAAELRAFADAAREGRYDDAVEIALGMDTDVDERIPTRLYNAVFRAESE